MSFKFASHKLLNGLFEPEGVYLAPPLDGLLHVLQGWGEHANPYAASHYNGVPLKGHVGLDLAVTAGARLLATDAGRVVELAVERGGFERYIKLEHRWGESLYACVGEALVESGQSVQRGEAIALALDPSSAPGVAPGAGGRPWFHFGVRVAPYNRYDGWGGFTDPTPYLPPGSLAPPNSEGAGGGDVPAQIWAPHPMADERLGIRRP
ncbi:MAG: peptidoglycan DD-metalloendopeptidase family protein [Caldilineaceae bacterium]